MVAALKRGEIDAAEDVPGASFTQLEKDQAIETVEGYQGAMSEIAINGGDGLKKPHPALLDKRVRQAIGHAIDRETIVDRVLAGLGKPLGDAERVAQPGLDAGGPARAAAHLRPRPRALDPRGRRLQGHRRRRRPRDARRRAAAELPSTRSAPRARPGPATAEFITGWLKEIGIDDHGEGLRRQPPHRGHRQGRLRHVRLGLDPVRRPGHDALVLQLRPGRERPRGPDELLQRRELVRQGVRQALRAAEGRARPGQARGPRPRDARCASTTRPSTTCCTSTRTCRRTGRASSTGFVRQPEKTGPVLYSNSSPSYARLKLASATAGGSGMTAGAAAAAA